MNAQPGPPEITVVVSVFNKADTVEKCISSILEIDYPAWKTLIIEGYSSDGSYELLDKFRDRIRIVRMEGNYASALNRALALITTPLIAITDADCTVDSNWLRELAAGFAESDEIAAVAGYVGTGEKLPLLPTLIGIEFQERYRHFPRYISRGPTMNLCVRTDVARLVGFDESLPFAIETDFGFRLTKLGKMLYNPLAAVRHYPRTTWNGFFRQQIGFARGAFQVYEKHKKRLKGDPISTFGMISQVPILALAIACAFLSAVHHRFGYAALALFILLILIYVKDMLRLPIRKRHYPMMLALFIARTAGWLIGTLQGIFSSVAAHSKVPHKATR
jgi:cellulose synthase/poly-beta-1,6-N-acetylglucosamine synthase-like glycosyltransferase